MNDGIVFMINYNRIDNEIEARIKKIVAAKKMEHASKIENNIT